MRNYLFIVFLLLCLSPAVSQTISDITVSQRSDGSKLIDVYYDLSGTEESYAISMQVSLNSGNTWQQANYLQGDVYGVSPGSNRNIVWNAGTEMPNQFTTTTRIRLTATFSNFTCPPSVTDVDGNTYNTVLIGDQCWMQENLKVTHYPNGDAIPYITNNSSWGALGDNNTDDAYCYYNNNTGSEYGALYSYAAAIADNWVRDNNSGQGICPDGWHLPIDAEWKVLEGTVDTQYPVGDPEWDGSGWRGYDAGTHMKSISGWSYSGNGDNSSGFTALPGCFRTGYYGAFGSAGYRGYWWSATEYSSTNARCRLLLYNSAGVYRHDYYKSYGFSVRCLKTDPSTIPTTSAFSAAPTIGHIPLTVIFADSSSNNTTSWQWDFGDGSTSTEQNPTHIYTTAGSFNVSLITSNGTLYDTLVKEHYITPYTPCPNEPTVTDIDGNTYNTVLIGDQCWMQENLKVTHYPNGDAIPYITDNNEWGALGDNNTDDAYCYYNNNTGSEYGALYSYAAAIADNWVRNNNSGQGICPDGWHLPTDAEWKILEGTVDTQYPVGDPEWDDDFWRGFDAGTHLKSTQGWNSNGVGDNASGFSAMPCGYRDNVGQFFSTTNSGDWWSATEMNSSYSWDRYLYYVAPGVNRYFYRKSYGISVRCVKSN